jgi:hypothetical protein
VVAIVSGMPMTSKGISACEKSDRHDGVEYWPPERPGTGGARNPRRQSERNTASRNESGWNGLLNWHMSRTPAEARVKVHMKSILRKIQVANRTQRLLGHCSRAILPTKLKAPADSGLRKCWNDRLP